MAYTVTRFVLDLTGLTASEKAVAHSLAHHAGMDGANAFPSMLTIAREAGLNRRYTQKVMRRLEEKGVIVAEGSKTGGRYRSTRYRFNLWLENSVHTDAPSSGMETASSRTTKGVLLDQKQRPIERPKDPERSYKYPLEKPHTNLFASLSEDDLWIVQLLEDEEDIIQSIPSGLIHWVTNFRPLPSSVQLSDDDAAKSFDEISRLFYNGAAWLGGKKRGSFATLQDYEPIWVIDENYGPGTAVALANQMIAFGVGNDDPLHIVSTRSFVWHHLADQLIEAVKPTNSDSAE